MKNPTSAVSLLPAEVQHPCLLSMSVTHGMLAVTPHPHAKSKCETGSVTVRSQQGAQHWYLWPLLGKLDPLPQPLGALQPTTAISASAASHSSRR